MSGERDPVDAILDRVIAEVRQLPHERAFGRLEWISVAVIRRGTLTPARRERLLAEASALEERAARERPALQTIATAEPSVSPPPMVRHIIERDRNPATGEFDGPFKDAALCGHLWDRLLPNTPGPICLDCRAEAKRRTEGRS